MSYSLEAHYSFSRRGDYGSYEIDCLTRGELMDEIEKIRNACLFLGILEKNLTFHVNYSDDDGGSYEVEHIKEDCVFLGVFLDNLIFTTAS